MKRTIRTVALIATIGLTAASCQKEQISPTQTILMEDSSTQVMHYSVDGASYSVSINGEASMNAFWQQIFALVREGYEVEVFNESKTNNVLSTKEVITYTTKSEEDAHAWAVAMTDQGYHVNITYKDGVYTCTAIR